MKHRKMLLWMFFLVPLLGLFMLVNVAEARTTHASAAYQAFDGGIMLWESSEGGIWVLAYDGTATYYPQSVYASRPDNPVTETPPAGRVKPISGFGKVWGNFSSVRTTLGWGLSAEWGYVATINEVRELNTYLAQIRINLPTGGTVTIDPYQRTWSGGGVTPGPTPTYTPTPVQQPSGYIPPFSDGSQIATTLQAFENGFMLWIAGTGDIYVFNTNTFGYERFPVWSYAGQPDNPVTTQPPDGLIKPGFGFGKVWGNNPLVRSQLGWATTGEQGVLMPFARSIDPVLQRETYAFDTGTRYGWARVDPVTNTWQRE